MKIQYASDLHLEFPENSDYLIKNPITPIGDILILAGDITYFDGKYFSNPFFDKISKNFKETFILCGNHEYYGGFDVSQHKEPFIYKVKDNVFYLNNQVIKRDNVELIFTTLWSNIPDLYKETVQKGVNDYYKVYFGDNLLTPEIQNKLHQNCLTFLKKALNQPTKKKRIVITHHLPSYSCIHPYYQGSPINSAFANNQEGLIEKLNIDYWIYGHTHANMEPITIGKTKLLINTFGYVHFQEHQSFQNDLIIKI